MPTDPPPTPARREGGYAVAVLAIAFILNFTGRGIADALAAFVLPLEAEFGWRRSALTGVFATYMLVSGLAAPVAGFVFDRFGPRAIYCSGLFLLGAAALVAGFAQSLWQIYLGAGVLMGAGSAATGMVCATTLIARWYRTRLTTAIAIAYAGAGCGALVLLPVAQSLIDAWGWRTAWMAMATLPLVAGPLCLALPWRKLAQPPAAPAVQPRLAQSDAAGPSGAVAPGTMAAGATVAGTAVAGTAVAGTAVAGTAAEGTAVEGTRAHGAEAHLPADRLGALRAAWADPCYWQLAQIFFFTALASYHVTPQVVAMLIESGMKPIVAASAYGFAGLLSTVGIIGAGWLGDRLGHQRAGLASFVLTASGLAGLLWVALRGAPLGLIIYVVGFGLAQGARGPIVSMLSNRIFAGPAAATIYGTIYALMALGAAIGAWTGGLLHDLSNAYWPLVAAGLALIGLAALPFRSASALMVRSGALTGPRARG